MPNIISHPDLTPWKPEPTEIPESCMKLALELEQDSKGSQRAYVMNVKYNARQVGSLLCSWGLPWQVVAAGYLWEHDKQLILKVNPDGTDEVLSHIEESNLYYKYIDDENLPPLLNPPYRDLGGLLIAMAIYYQVLQELQQQSNEKTYTGVKLSQIESVGRTLLNIAKSLGMWYFKRDIEDLLEQIRSPRKFVELRKEHARVLQQDALMLEETRKVLIATYQEATKQPITVVCTPCGVAGMKRRQQDVRTTALSSIPQLTGFDLVTFDVIVPRVNDCYAAFGVLNQLGYTENRMVIEQLANPKPNGNSHIALGLILKPQGPYTQALKWPETHTRICHLQIATPFMQAVTWYGCLFTSYYELYASKSLQDAVEFPTIQHLWHSEEGKVFPALKEFLATRHPHVETKAPIIVYDKSRDSIALPKGATALDFAYKLDGEFGDHAVEAFINNRQAPLYRILDAGDIVEIRTSNEDQAQDYWLSDDYAITSFARHQIKESLNRRFPYPRGYHSLLHLLERYNINLSREDLERELRLLLKQHNLGTPQSYLKRLDKIGEPPYTTDWASQQIMRQLAERSDDLPMSEGRASWNPILDMDLAVTKKFIHQQRLCNFCQPTYPRDMKIMGRLRKRSGELIVHKATCPHLIDRTKAQQSVLLPMTWKLQPPTFRVAFFVTAQDRKGLILDLVRHLRRHNCDLLSIAAKALSKFGEAQILFTLEAYSDKEVLDIWHEMSRIENVSKVEIDAAATSARTRERLQKLRKQEIALPGNTSLEHAWEESMVTLQPRNPTLKNPFDISRPASAKMFFGRSAVTKIMQRELCDEEQGKALILYGPRRSGKSSICKNFLDCQTQPLYWGVLFSLQNFIQHKEEHILMQLAERVCEEFEEHFHLSAPEEQHYQFEDPQFRFKQVVQACLAKVPGSRLILSLDEFGGVVESYEKGILESRFFSFWKDLLNEIPQLSLIFALPTSAHNTLSSIRIGNAFSFAQPLPVIFLDTKSAEQLLIDPLRDQNVEIYPNTVALAVKLTGGNPYFMTLIGQQLIHHLNQETDKQLITDEDLRLVVEYLVEDGFNQNFEYLKSELQSNEEFHLLEAIVEITTRSNQSKVQLKKIASWLNLPISVTRQHLERLRNGLILQENGPTSNPYYSFTIELMSRWLTHNHWFFLPSTNK